MLGSSYHPQAQSAVERPHREYKKICQAFMTDNREWSKMAYLFQWSVRTSCKLANPNYTPYEIITGLKPRSPIDAIVSSPVEKVDVGDYVSQLVKYVKDVHKQVDRQRRMVQDQRQDAQNRKYGTGQYLNVGDYCYVRRPPTPGISQRFQRRHYDDIFQVVERHGDGAEAKAYTLCDVNGSRELGFDQPVASERLVPVQLTTPERPIDEKTKLVIINGTTERRATVKSQCVDGKVNIQYDD